MKTLFTFFLPLYIVPIALIGQPVISNNEFYEVGDVITMVNCDPSSISVGTAGAGVLWDFSHVTPSAGTSTTTVLHDTSSFFSTSNLMILLPDGSIEHMQENSTDSYINGIRDTAHHVTIDFTNYDIAVRPFTYNTATVDSYNVDVPATATTGVGHLTQLGDAYGTLKLPTGIFNNVLRIKKVQVEIDTVATNVYTSRTVSYLWFDNIHNAPLFRYDSITSVTNTTQTAMYLSTPSAVPVLARKDAKYEGYLGDNELLVTGGFDNGRVYEIIVYNLIGSKVLNYEFTATGNTQRLSIGRPLSPGIYMVSIMEKGGLSDREVIKVIKQ